MGPVATEVESLDCHRSDFFFHFHRIHHHDGVPWTSIEEAAVWALADALLATDAQNRIDLHATEWRVIFIRHPEHAIFDGAVFDARGRTGAPGAAFGDDREFFGLFLTWSGEALGLRFELQFVGDHPDRFGRSGHGRHARHYTPECKTRMRVLKELKIFDCRGRLASAFLLPQAPNWNSHSSILPFGGLSTGFLLIY